MRRPVISLLLSFSMLLGGCASTPTSSDSTTVTEDQANIHEAAESDPEPGDKQSCYSLKSVSLTVESLIIHCRNPQQKKLKVEVAAGSPVAISMVLDLIAIKMRYNRLPDESPDLMDTINETRDLISLKFNDKRVRVMILEFSFDEHEAGKLQKLTTRFEVLGDKPVLPE